MMPSWLSSGHALRRSRGLRLGWSGLAVLAVILAAAFVAARLDPLPPPFTGEARASDGDSLWVGDRRVRILGIDAPELDQVCWRADGAEWPCGRDARALLAELLAAGPVACEPHGQDRFGRTLARCSAGAADVGAWLVESGLAIAREGYDREQRAAQREKRGLWSGRFLDPREWRDDGPADDPGPSMFETIWRWFRELTGATTLR